jgi:hypothetical protein
MPLRTDLSLAALDAAAPDRPGLGADTSVNRFRSRRGAVLRDLIQRLSEHLGRDIAVLDVGGRPDYWSNVGVERIARIELLNLSRDELDRPTPPGLPRQLFDRGVGDARNLVHHGDKSVDLVHSNSVIEHVGGWPSMAAMARELMRVGRAGWVQTPAWEFPLEPHFRVPFMHWLGRPLQARMLGLSPLDRHRRADLVARRRRVENVNLLTRSEVRALFPGCALHVERLVIAKSYSAHWLPEGMAEA